MAYELRPAPQSRSARAMLAILLVVGLLAIAVVGLASAADGNPHLNSPPTFTDLGLQLKAIGQVYGLGNGGNVFLSATADATATCTNPSHKSKPPGQNPASVTVKGHMVLDPDPKPGSRSFTVITDKPTSPIFGSTDFSCPNKDWTETITDLQFKTATLTATSQSDPTQGFALADCSFSPATSDGPVTSPPITITC